MGVVPQGAGGGHPTWRGLESRCVTQLMSIYLRSPRRQAPSLADLCRRAAIDEIFTEDSAFAEVRSPQQRGIVFTEDVVKIAGQQGRYAVGGRHMVLHQILDGLWRAQAIRPCNGVAATGDSFEGMRDDWPAPGACLDTPRIFVTRYPPPLYPRAPVTCAAPPGCPDQEPQPSQGGLCRQRTAEARRTQRRTP